MEKITPSFAAKAKEGHRFFATFNPGYAGRVDIPDNLAKISTSVAKMTVPLYESLVLGMLITEGFFNFATLGNKMCQIRKYLMETLPPLDYIDYSLRQFKFWVITAGAHVR